MPGLEKQPITWPLTGGLATKQAPLMQVPGTHLVLENVRQERLHEWRARSGHTRAAADDYPTANIPVRAVQLDDGGGLVTLSRETSGGAAFVYSPSMTTRWTNPIRSAVVFPSTWARKAVAPHSVRPIKTTTASGGTGRLTLVAWENSAAATYGIETYLLTPEGEVRANTHLGAAGASRPCAVYDSTNDRLALVYIDGTTVKVVVWDAVSGAITFGPSTLDATAADATLPFIDCVYYVNPGFRITVVYRTGANQIRFCEYDTSIGTTAVAVTIAVACDNCLCLLPDPEGSAVRFVAFSDAANVIVKRVNTAGTVLTTDTADTVVAANICGVAYQAGAGWMIAYTVPGAGPAFAPKVKATKKRSGAVATPLQIAGDSYQVDSGAWRESGVDQMRFIVGLHVNTDPLGTGGVDSQHTYYEKALEYDVDASMHNFFDEAQARLVPLNASDNFNADVQARISQVQRIATDTYLLALPRVSRVGIQSATNANQYTIDLWTVTYLNNTNRTSLNQGRGLVTSQASYIPVGTLLQTVNGNVMAHGAMALPRIPSLAQSAGGSLTASSTYGYLITIEMPDENGNIWRSGPSPVNSITLGGAGANKTVTVTVYLPDLELGGRTRTVKIWRTFAGGSVFRLRVQKTGTVADTATVTLVDSVADSSMVTADVFDTAEAPTTITPRFLHVELWNRHFWGVDADYPDRLWFSKPLIPGISPEFVATQVMFLDDDKGDITGIDAFDDRLMTFKVTGTYVISGDGPDRTGAGAFPSATQIDGELGAKIGSPTVSTGSDVFFVSTRGIYRVSRSLEMDFVGEPVDVFLNQALVQAPSTVAAAVFSPSTNEVRFQLVNGTGYERLVYDRLHNLWIHDTADSGGDAILYSLMLGGKQAFFLDNKNLWFEGIPSVNLDAANGYNGRIRSAWIRGAGFDSWLRLYRARAMGERTNVSAGVTPVLKVYFDNGATPVNGSPSVPLQNTPWRVEFRPAKQACSTFSLELQLAATDVTTRLEAWGVVVGLKKGTQPLTPAERWA